MVAVEVATNKPTPLHTIRLNKRLEYNHPGYDHLCVVLSLACVPTSPQVESPECNGVSRELVLTLVGLSSALSIAAADSWGAGRSRPCPARPGAVRYVVAASFDAEVNLRNHIRKLSGRFNAEVNIRNHICKLSGCLFQR